MKILKRNDEFRKLPEKSLEDVLAIRNLISQGWNYCSRELYKESVNGKKVEKKIDEVTSEPVKTKKSDKKKSERK